MQNHAPSASFEDWYAKYYPRLVARARRIVADDAAAEDVAQETLVRAWQKRECLQGRSEVLSWMMTVCRNLAIDSVRAQSRLTCLDAAGERASDGPQPERRAEREAERAEVDAALGQVSQRHRDLLYLHDGLGVGYQELAQRFGLTPGAARAVLMRARRSFRDAYERAGGFAGGVVVPARFGRGWFDNIRQAVSSAGDRLTTRQALAAELAAGAIAVAAALGSVTPGDHGPARQPSAATPPAAVQTVHGIVDLATTTEAASAAVASTAGSSIPASAPDVEVPPPPKRQWHASVRVLSRPDDPSSGLGLGVSVQGKDRSGAAGAVLRIADALPDVETSLLNRRR